MVLAIMPFRLLLQTGSMYQLRFDDMAWLETKIRFFFGEERTLGLKYGNHRKKWWEGAPWDGGPLIMKPIYTL